LPFPESRAAVMSLFYRLIDPLRTESCPPRLLPVLRYIREHACDEGGLSNATLARVAGMSEVNFRKQFSAAFQCSPVRYVTELRLQRAKLLLSESDEPVAGIAEACGFSNPYHFCRAFRRHEGVSPSAWRKENRTATLEAL
jgi:AraC-like DNA-binding protein